MNKTREKNIRNKYRKQIPKKNKNGRGGDKKKKKTRLSQIKSNLTSHQPRIT